MTAPTDATPYERAEYVSALVTASLRPGGPLYVRLSDLITMAQGVAMDAAGIATTPDGERLAEGWTTADDDEDHIAFEIASRFFTVALHYFEANEHPTLTVVAG